MHQHLSSLDWFHEALNERATSRRATVLRWLRGLPFLSFHISIYACVVIALFAINLAQAPDDLWFAPIALAWLAIIVIHGAITGIIWAIGLLNLNEDARDAEQLRWSAASWRTVGRQEPQEADYRQSALTIGTLPLQAETPDWRAPTSSGEESPSIPVPEPDSSSHESAWNGWVDPQASEPEKTTDTGADEDRASWREAAAAAWLTPAENVGDAPITADADVNPPLANDKDSETPPA